jgi:APA family basic amino acid/polyamine antiporter
LGAAFPIAGGEYIYLRRVYGPFVGFLSGWTSFTIGFSAAIAAGAVSFAAYLLQLFPLDDEGGMRSTAFALALLWSITGFHLASVGPGGFLQRTLTVLKVGAIFLLIVTGLTVGTGDWAHLRLSDTHTVPGIGPCLVSLIFALYAYSALPLDAHEWLEPGHLPRQVCVIRRIDHLADILVSARRFFGNAAERRTANQNPACG